MPGVPIRPAGPPRTSAAPPERRRRIHMAIRICCSVMGGIRHESADATLIVFRHPTRGVLLGRRPGFLRDTSGRGRYLSTRRAAAARNDWAPDAHATRRRAAPYRSINDGGAGFGRTLLHVSRPGLRNREAGRRRHYTLMGGKSADVDRPDIIVADEAGADSSFYSSGRGTDIAPVLYNAARKRRRRAR